MGISLSYWSVQQPAEPVIRTIKADVQLVNASRQWWSENISFFDWHSEEGRLVGDTQLMPLAFFEQIDRADNTFMACRDLIFIIAQLGRWSRAFQLDWKLDCCGQRGQIIGGELDQAARSLIANWRLSANVIEGVELREIEARAELLLDKYATRTRNIVFTRME